MTIDDKANNIRHKIAVARMWGDVVARDALHGKLDGEMVSNVVAYWSEIALLCEGE